ncbi:MAG: terminase small subunit [Rhodospirillales bacterium]|nr:terminase small subunit [Rhodospirillales bacterium]
MTTDKTSEKQVGQLSPKQEKFCLVYIETGNASEAYRQSYNAVNMKPETINRKAKVELDKGKIRARVQELQEAHCERHDVTVDSLTTELESELDQ